MPDLTGLPEEKELLEKMGLPSPKGKSFKNAEKVSTTKPEIEGGAKSSESINPEVIASIPEQETPETVVQKMAEAPAVSAVTSVAQIKDELTAKIEEIMTEDLETAFKQMNPAQQQAFKTKGEETVDKIKLILNSAKVKFKKIVKLLVDWMRMIPGVNKFYLEQEAKIKADKLIHLNESSIYDSPNEKI